MSSFSGDWKSGWWLALLFMASLTGCRGNTSDAPPAATSGTLQVVATTGMVGDLVAHVAGDLARVQVLMPAGVDPHLYKPTTSDVADIQKADLVFYNGLGLEGPMQPIFERAAQRGRTVVAVTQDLPKSAVSLSEEFNGHADPHVWMDVALWKQCLKPVVDSLSKARPEDASRFQANAEAYEKQLDELDAYVRKAVASIPEGNRTLVTAHDAFAYFSRSYGIPVKAVQGISTESEPGVNDINELVSFLVSSKVPALFVESSVNDRNLMAVREGVSQRGGSVAIGGRLFSDAMGPEGTYEGTYIGMMDHNSTRIAKALGGSVPEAGLNGKLTAETKTAP